MKKLFLSLAAAAAFTVSAKAQVTFIPKAGLSIANVAFKEKADGQKANTGLLVGAGFNIPLDQDGFFSVQPEVLYIQKGVGMDMGSNIETKFKLNYLEIPVLAKISFGSEAVKGYVNAGPSIGYALNGKVTASNGSNSGSSDIEFGSSEEQTKRTDFGLQFGGGVGFAAGPGTLLLDLRYGMGLSNLSNESGDDAKSQNRVVAISVGYAIPLGGK